MNWLIFGISYAVVSLFVYACIIYTAIAKHGYKFQDLIIRVVIQLETIIKAIFWPITLMILAINEVYLYIKDEKIEQIRNIALNTYNLNHFNTMVAIYCLEESEGLTKSILVRLLFRDHNLLKEFESQQDKFVSFFDSSFECNCECINHDKMTISIYITPKRKKRVKPDEESNIYSIDDSSIVYMAGLRK